MDVAALLEHVNAAQGVSYRLVGRLPGGTRGAYGIIGPDGTRAVLKPSADPLWIEQLRRVVPIVEHVRAGGYPTPRFLHVGPAPDGTAYHVREYVEGEPLRPLTPAGLELVLALNDLQADVRLPTQRSWSSYVRGVVFDGESGWTDALAAHSAATRELLAAVRASVAPHASAVLSSADVVHGDFSGDHVIVRAGRVAGVVDFEAAGAGTRAIDLAVMLGWNQDDLSEDDRRRVYWRIREIAGEPGLAICVCYQVINMAAFAVLHMPSALAANLARGWTMLREMERV